MTEQIDEYSIQIFKRVRRYDVEEHPYCWDIQEEWIMDLEQKEFQFVRTFLFHIWKNAKKEVKV